MKKAIALISALMMAVCSFTACGKDEDNSSKDSDKEIVDLAVANSTASSISKAFMSSVIDMDVEGVYTKGLYIFSSDSGKVILEDESADSLGGNAEEVYKDAEKYFERLNENEYFAVCINGSCIYAAVETDGVIGTFPSGQIVSKYEGGSCDFEKFDTKGADLDEVYDKCMEALG